MKNVFAVFYHPPSEVLGLWCFWGFQDVTHVNAINAIQERSLLSAQLIQSGQADIVEFFPVESPVARYTSQDILPNQIPGSKPILAETCCPAKLVKAVVEVHQQIADDHCWMDIDKIFQAAGLPVPDRKVGDKRDMLQNCERYIQTLCQSGGWISYAELKRRLDQIHELSKEVRTE